MTSHWPKTQERDPWAPREQVGVPGGRFELSFARHGARTHIGRQFVSYPFHITRPFALDAAIPSLLTIYQQSSSGGLYRGEQLSSCYELGANAAAHITTQAATIVHHCHGEPARQHSEVIMQEGAFLALTPDPLVLFPGAACENTLIARLAPGAILLLADAFARHDPDDRSRSFDQLSSHVRIEDSSGRLLARDCFRIAGDALAGAASPIGNWRAVANYMLLGDCSLLPSRQTLTQSLSFAECVTGVSELPNGIGWGIRCLAANAIAARAVSERLFVLAVEAAFGASPTPRRK
jgi:urease accessory protein